MAGPCYYVWFRKTTGGETQGTIVSNMKNLEMDFDAPTFMKTTGSPPEEDTDYGVLEVTEVDFNAMDTNINSGTYGKHVDDPTGTPALADGDPS